MTKLFEINDDRWKNKVVGLLFTRLEEAMTKFEILKLYQWKNMKVDVSQQYLCTEEVVNLIE